MNSAARQYYKATSNNAENPNQNVCGHYVARALGVDESVRYIHTFDDIKRAVNRRYSFRSVKSSLADTVGASRKLMIKLCKNDSSIISFVIMTPRHVIMLDKNGKTTVDTAPRKADRRRVLQAYAVRKYKGC